jgi:hypothetical protein
MNNWNNEKLNLEEKIATKKMKIQKMKTKNSDFIREISNLRRQIRKFVQTSIFIQSTFI